MNQGYINGIRAVIEWFQCQWHNPESYEWLEYMNLLRSNYTVTAKQSTISLWAYLMRHSTIYHPLVAKVNAMLVWKLTQRHECEHQYNWSMKTLNYREIVYTYKYVCFILIFWLFTAPHVDVWFDIGVLQVVLPQFWSIDWVLNQRI